MYELMVISKTDSAGDVFGKIEKFLQDIEASELKSEKLGKKTLAYPIARQSEAEYFLFNFEADAAALKGLADKIRLEQESILRHLLVKMAKPRKESKRKRVTESKIEEVKKEEVKIKPKVTVTTKGNTPSSAKDSEDKKVKKASKAK